MRKLFVSIAFLSLFVFAGSALADCADPVAGPYYLMGLTYYDYTRAFSDSCWTVGSGINTPNSSQTMYCTGDHSYDFRSFSPDITYSFTVKNDGITSTTWELSFDFEGVDPHSSWWNQLSVNVYVYHPGQGYHNANIFGWNGTMGNDQSCSRRWGTFTAHVGDDVLIDFAGSGSGDSDSHVMVQNPVLLRY
jgi:hypothetical protein